MTRRWLRAAAGLVGALALLAGLWVALAWWVLPPWLQSRTESELGGVFGRPVKVAAMRIEPWPLAIEADGITVQARHAGRPPLLQIARLRAVASAASITERALVLDEFGVDGLRIAAERTGRAQTDIDDLLHTWMAPRPAPAADEPLPRVVVRRFALRDAAVAIDDRTAGRQHTIEGLAFSVDGLSTRPEDAGQAWQARLALRLNGSALRAEVEGTPLAPDRRLRWRSSVDALDLAAFRADVDGLLPLRLQSAHLSAAIDGRFEHGGSARAQIELRGHASLAGLSLHYPDGSPALKGRELQVQIGALRPFDPQGGAIEIDRVRIEGAVLPLVRAASGKLNLESLAAAETPRAAPNASTAPPWTVTVRELELDDATIGWRDLATASAAAMTVAGLKARATDIRLPALAPVTLHAQAQLRAADGAAAGRFSVDGKAGAQHAALKVALDDFDLRALQPYLAAWRVPRVEQGLLHTSGRIDWTADAQRSDLRLGVDEARVDDLVAGNAGWRSLVAQGLTLDFGTSQAQLAELRVEQPRLRVARDAQGHIDLAGWLRVPPASAATAPGAASADKKPARAAAPAWRVQADKIQVAGGRLDVADAMPAGSGAHGPLALRIDGLALRVGTLRWPLDTTPTPIGLRGQFVLPTETASAERRFAIRGELGLAPLAWKGRIELQRAPLHAFARYAPIPETQRVLGADAGLRAQLEFAQTPAGWRAAVDGDASLTDLRIVEQGAASDDLLSWRSLIAEGLQVRLAPGQSRRIAIREIQLTGLDSRLVVTEQGELHLATVGALRDEPAPPRSAPAATNAEGAIDLEVGSTRLVDGKIDFEDHFIRPNYRAELTALNGHLGTIRSHDGEAAALVLGGTVAGSGTLEVSGNLNPTVRPPVLNLRARAKDIELPPLSAYSGKYAGYGITEGTISVDVSYRIEPDGKLEAKNRIVLNRLTFGEPVESPSATKLPVRFLVALLKDRNGVIDLNLPIAGSLNQPDFRLGPLIVELLVKLLTRAVASPFAALAGEDADKLGAIGFVAGTADFATDAAPALDQVAKVLDSRPALTLDIVGTADPASEAEAFRQAALDARVAALGAESAGQPPTAEQREQRLRQLYRQSDLPDRPRNLIGRLAEVPSAEMAARLRASIPVGADAMRDLALERGLAVRSALIGRGVASERLFVGTPALRAADDAGWTPRARLSLIAP